MSLEFRQIAYRYGQHQALADINLTVPTGEITCLLGSSGCGKTTLLNLAAGLLRAQTGSIHVGDDLLADFGVNPPPEKRPIGLVFQDGALFPHMTIAQNIAFGLPATADREDLVAGWLDQIGLSGMGERYPDSLSGGQQQRVALARAMAPEPAILLLDEPFASVDIVVRRSLRRECRRLLKARGATAILVTHDPEEAMDVGDRIAVMDKGRIVQAGSPAMLYDQPVSAQVGALFGDAQIFAGTLTASGLDTPFGLWPLNCLKTAPTVDIGTQCEVLVRKRSLTCVADPEGLTVADIRRDGHVYAIEMITDQGERIVIERDSIENDIRERTWSVLPAEGSVTIFPAGPGVEI